MASGVVVSPGVCDDADHKEIHGCVIWVEWRVTLHTDGLGTNPSSSHSAPSIPPVHQSPNPQRVAHRPPTGMGRRARRLRGVLEDLHHDARKVRHQTGTGSGGGAGR